MYCLEMYLRKTSARILTAAVVVKGCKLHVCTDRIIDTVDGWYICAFMSYVHCNEASQKSDGKFHRAQGYMDFSMPLNQEISTLLVCKNSLGNALGTVYWNMFILQEQKLCALHSHVAFCV